MDELIQFSQQEEIIFFLFREIEAGVEDDLLSAQSSLDRNRCFFLEEIRHRFHQPSPLLMRVWNFWLTN